MHLSYKLRERKQEREKGDQRVRNSCDGSIEEERIVCQICWFDDDDGS
jgi:hypothetical protein